MYGSNPSVADRSYTDYYSVDNEVESHACNDDAHALCPKEADLRSNINQISYLHISI